MVKILEILYGLLCNLEIVLIPYKLAVDLVTIKNRLHTTLFLVLATSVILFYETMLPLAFLLSAIHMFYNLYEHKSFSPPKPDVHGVIEFIKDIADFIAAVKYNLYVFMNEVYYWKDPVRA
jgi:hypothetical protein